RDHQAQWRPIGEPRRAAGYPRSAMGRGQQLDGRHRPCAGIPARCVAGGRGEVVRSRTTLTVPPPENQLTALHDVTRRYRRLHEELSRRAERSTNGAAVATKAIRAVGLTSVQTSRPLI